MQNKLQTINRNMMPLVAALGTMTSLCVNGEVATAAIKSLRSLSSIPVYTGDSVLVIDPSAQALITSLKRPLVDQITEIMRQEALKFKLAGTINVSSYKESVTGRPLLRIKQALHCDGEKAMAHWDRIDVAITQWITSLRKDQAEAVQNEMWLDIEWDLHGSAI